MKGRRKLQWFLAGCGAVVSILALTSLPPKEPQYEGRPLTFWLRACYSNHGTVQLGTKCSDAVRHIGTNALPFLLQRVAFERRPWRAKCVAVFDKLPRPLWSPGLRDFITGDSKERLAESAEEGFYALGPDGAAAVPGLLAIANQASTPTTRYRAKYCLACVLPPPQVLLGRVGFDDVHVMQSSLKALTTRGIEISDSAIMDLGLRLRLSANPAVRRTAATALGEFGQRSRTQTEILRYELRDDDATVREAVTNALLKVAPEILNSTPKPVPLVD